MKEQYEFLKPLGEGGFSRVYLARHRILGREAAIKEIPPEKKDRENRKYGLEARLLARGISGALPCLYDAFEEEGALYLVMEYVKGRSLKEEIRCGMPLARIRDTALQLSTFLMELHSHSPAVVYLDLKPENILLEENGRVRVLDLGAARYPDEKGDRSFTGTKGYAPKAQELGEKPVPAWDIYAFGVLLYEMLTGLPMGKIREQSLKERLLSKEIPIEYRPVLEACFLSPSGRSGILDGSGLQAALQDLKPFFPGTGNGFRILRSIHCCEVGKKNL
ncbi:MAG: serine/threonine protein kinase [Lachnospiraceae bacterium]|nr:serine/threonine protein kinase [Lachnospiraceae bacterium]